MLTFSRAPLPYSLSRMDCCCHPDMGLAWSPRIDSEYPSSSCESCPKRGSAAFDRLCLHATPITTGPKPGKDEGPPKDGGLHIVEGGGAVTITVEECVLLKLCGRHGSCVGGDSAGGYGCRCDAGYEPRPGGKSCRDINECLSPGGRCRGGRCRNTQGSFECICPPGT